VFNYKLDADPSKHGVMLTEPILNPVSNAKKVANSMFETYSAPYIGTAPGPVMALYASGRSHGCVLNVGGGLTQCIPIIDGYPVLAIDRPMAVQETLNFGARDVTRYLGRTLMPHRGAWLHSMAEEEIMQNVLETICFVPTTAEVFDEYEHNPVESQSTYTMPDGLELQIGHERFKAGEAMFRPELGLCSQSISQLVHQVISKTDSGVKSDLLSNIVLAGSLSLMEGFNTRLSHDMSVLSQSPDVRVIAKPERKYLEWIGASINATLSSFSENWITAAEYEEFGPSIVDRKGMFRDLLRRSDQQESEDPLLRPKIVAEPTQLEAPADAPKRHTCAEHMRLWRICIEGEAEIRDGKIDLHAALMAAPDMDAGDPSNEGLTGLHFASKYGNEDIVEQLIAAGVNVQAEDDYGKTALHWAAQEGRSLHTVECLIAGGVNVNGGDRFGRTALHYAARGDHGEIVQALIAAGADKAAPDKTFRTPCDWAVSDATRSALLDKAGTVAQTG